MVKLHSKPVRFLVTRLARAYGFLDPVTLLARLRGFAQQSEVGEPIELLRAGMLFHAAQADDRAHRLGVVAVGLGLGVDVLHIVGDALLFLFEALDAFDEKTQLVGRDIGFAHVNGSLGIGGVGFERGP